MTVASIDIQSDRVEIERNDLSLLLLAADLLVEMAGDVEGGAFVRYDEIMERMSEVALTEAGDGARLRVSDELQEAIVAAAVVVGGADFEADVAAAEARFERH